MDFMFTNINGIKVPVYSMDAVVIGTGCAGYNAADWLHDLGKRDIAIITEGIKMGTSRNTGSDKQTYYKLSLASDGSDSIKEMADTLFAGGSVNGDTALVEAACSVKSFIKLTNLGVPFPTNIYGEYVGYKTDHDPRQRATSAGPLTSKYMTECLELSVNRKGIKIFDGMQAVKLIVKDDKVLGLLAIDQNNLQTESLGFTLFNCAHVIMATGGPAGVYYTSVYPESQTGMTGMALEAGAAASNLQEWQYGLASTKFRWNVSGTYQQVLPRYISIDKDGVEREFLPEYFENPQKALDMVFLKGYQWPFDVAKISSSSIIDIIIHHEIFDKGNRVFMDFVHEPQGLENGFDSLSEETRNYLYRSNALVSTPIKRLEIMNKKAIELYKAHDIDLYNEALEVSVCAQHQNGGIAVDINWESNIKGLYVVGEAAGTFGVYRPGGSALNSTQVGSMRAAEHIVYGSDKAIADASEFTSIAASEVKDIIDDILAVYAGKSEDSNIVQNRVQLQKEMSKAAAHIRTLEDIRVLYEKLQTMQRDFFKACKINSAYDIPHMLKNRDILVTQLAVLSAISKAAGEIGSRGSGLVIDPQGEAISKQIPGYKYIKGKSGYNDKVILTTYKNGDCKSAFQPTRPFPVADDWFENVWNDYIKRTEKA